MSASPRLSPPFQSPLGLCALTSVIVATATLSGACKPAPAPAPITAAPQNPAPGAEAPASSDAAASPGVAPMTEVTWAQMDHGQKAQYMKQVVTPKMAELFQAFDPEHFGQFNCMTCHGPSVKQGNFEMPTAALPRLSAGFAAEKAEHPRGMEFMIDKVVPEMAKLLHEQPFDPSTQKGFGCFDCHLPKETAG